MISLFIAHKTVTTDTQKRIAAIPVALEVLLYIATVILGSLNLPRNRTISAIMTITPITFLSIPVLIGLYQTFKRPLPTEQSESMAGSQIDHEEIAAYDVQSPAGSFDEELS